MRLGWYAYHLNDITTTEWLKTTARPGRGSFSPVATFRLCS